MPDCYVFETLVEVRRMTAEWITRYTDEEWLAMQVTRVGVDLAKHVFRVHGVDRAERPVWCKRLRRERWIREIENTSPKTGVLASGEESIYGHCVELRHRWPPTINRARRSPRVAS